MQRISFALISSALLLSACAVPAGGQGYGQAAQQQQAGVDYCPERLPVAQDRIRELYSQPAERRGGEGVEATITGPNGESISVSVGTSVSAGTTPGPQDVQTGLSDLVLNCGADFSDHECFVEIYLDGEQLADLGPTTDGQVPFRCLPAGRHNLRIESVGQVIFDDVIRLDSDHEHLAEIKETAGGEARFEIYAVNELSGRIPAVPRQRETAQADSAGVSVRVDDGQDSVSAGATVRTGENDTYRDETYEEDDDYDQGYDHGYEDGHNDGHGHRAGPEAMSRSDFRSLMEAIEDESFKDGKLGVVKTAAKHNYFTSAQAAQIVEALDFSDSKVESAVLLYPQVVDPGNFHNVMGSLDYESDKKEVRERLGL